MAKRRNERINELLRREISEIIQLEMRDPNIGFATVLRVEVSGDLHYATVFTSVMGDDEQRENAIEHLNNAAGYIQSCLSSKIRLRVMPKIRFKIDRSLDHSFRINELIEKISHEENPAESDAGNEEGNEDEN